MKKHLGLIVRLLIAAAGITIIILIVNWHDRVYLPPGYVVAKGISGYDDGESYRVTDESSDAYLLEGKTGTGEAGPSIWLNKSEVDAGEGGPRFEPSVMTTLKQANGKLLILALFIYLPMPILGAYRWYILMRAREMSVTWMRTFRLTMAGIFFNLCMPGTTGGDVMKAYYAAKGSGQRSDALMSIVVDRLSGMVGLVLLVALLGLSMLGNTTVRWITLWMWVALLCIALGLWCFTHPAPRKLLRLDALLSKLPGGKLFKSLDDAAVAYRQHKKALSATVAMSVPIHLIVALSIAITAYAVGISYPIGYLLGVLPVAVLAGALPAGPLGLGPMDVVAIALLDDGGLHATAHQAAMTLVIFRIYPIISGLLGSLALIAGGIHLHPQTESDDGDDES